MRTSGLLPALGLLLALSVAQAEEAVVTSPFEATDKGGSLTLSSGTVVVTLDTYRRYQRVLDDLQEGDKVRFSVTEGRLASIEEISEATQNPRATTEVIGKYQGLTEDGVGDWYWIRVDGERYQLSPAVYAAKSGILLFLNPGARIKLEIRQNWVLDLSKNVAEVVIDEKLKELVSNSRPKDQVYVNGNEFRYKRGNENEIELHPRLPDGSISDGVVKFKLRDVSEYRNDAASARIRAGNGGGNGREQDVIDEEDVRVGDTIGIALQDGQVTDLRPDTITMMLWKNERWVGEKTWPREEVTRIRRIRLSTQQSVPLGSGQVFVRVNRWRHAASSGLGFEVEVTHDIEASLLVGVKLRVHLGGAAMAVTDQALSVEEVEVPDLFANDLISVSHIVTDDEFYDGRIELVATPENAVAIESKAAQPHILVAINAGRGKPDRLAQIYLAAGKNGDEGLLKLLIDRAAYPSGESPSERLRFADVAIAGLSESAAPSAELLLQGLHYMDRALKRTMLGGNDKLREETLSRFDILPLEHKRRLARLLGKLPKGLSGKNGEVLFDLYLARSNLGLAIEEAFGERPEEAVKTLLTVATSLNSASDEDEQLRATRATQLLQRLGEAVVDPLMGELRERGIDVRRLEQHRRTQGVPASDVILRALSFLIEHANAALREQLNRTVDDAQLLEAQGKWEEALTGLRRVLRIEPQHERALERLPSVLLEVADVRLAAKQRGDAARALEEAVELLPPPQKDRAKGPLAEVYLEAALEDTEGVVLRASPHRAANRVALAKSGANFPGFEVDNVWVELDYKDAKVYVNGKLVELSKKGGYKLIRAETSYSKVLKGSLEEIRKLSSTLKTRVDEVEGGLILREAVKKYEASDYHGALALFETAGSLSPGDDRLSLKKWAWLYANTVYLAGGIGVLLLTGFIGGMQLFSRPKKVKFEGDFHHYGRDRAERERGLDLDGAPAGEGGEDAG